MTTTELQVPELLQAPKNCGGVKQACERSHPLILDSDVTSKNISECDEIAQYINNI